MPPLTAEQNLQGTRVVRGSQLALAIFQSAKREAEAIHFRAHVMHYCKLARKFPPSTATAT